MTQVIFDRHMTPLEDLEDEYGEEEQIIKSNDEEDSNEILSERYGINNMTFGVQRNNR